MDQGTPGKSTGPDQGTNSFWLHYRRLEQGRFVRPRDGQDQAALQVTARQLRWLLDGLQWQNAVARQLMDRHHVC